MRVYNSLTRKVEDFRPSNPEMVTMYLCGPTVYNFISIGNYRTYTFGDFVHRTLLLNDYKVKYVMNYTDVGHMTGDNLGDADIGKDRLEAAAEREGRSARDIADYYINDFLKGYDRLNLLKPYKFTRATEYIPDQIALVRELERKGYAYRIADGIYFDTSKFEKYGQLSGMTAETIMEGARVEPNPEKRNPADFALWKFSPKDEKRWQEWDSPWGVGFPGWHLECSAMSMKELGETIDLHLGGEDLRMIHHQNEIAQSECASGKEFSKYWMHGAFLQVDGGRMGRSIGNQYTLTDLDERGFDPLALRYLFMTAHYRSPLNFTWESLQNAQNSLKHLYDILGGYKDAEKAMPSDRHIANFMDVLNDDINIPEALAVCWEMLKSNLGESVKLATILKMDKVLGLKLDDAIGYEIPQEVLDLVKTRTEYRKNGIWDKADLVRHQINDLGYSVEDLPDGKFKVRRKL
ncbi:cysteine--tRNA ligase [candidate division WWE3 bacterium RIFOXYD1_FULL_39_9]|uniref:Cysteine--tRNA ligase n=1 Tax=candidate division WWE3 bacterium RIFOXYD1_FULL_39_9 TaxID=1802649 RepID=A0A1F4X982_UNCKA|nr:MAG: cysteine--tRNA ligase [candidate division WWE3 bacterium RIFOXYD1_FULL_39_9]